MKRAREILKTFFETGDRPTENQFGDLIDSYFHIDDGAIITGIIVDDNGNTCIKLSDASEIRIQKQDDTFEIAQITNLQSELDRRVINIPGKVLTDVNFTVELSNKLANLENYIPPEMVSIGYVENLTEELESIRNAIDTKEDRGVQNNIVVTVDLGVIQYDVSSDPLLAVAEAINSLDPPIEVREEENVIFEFDLEERFFESEIS
ncbi:hypothetical protein U6A24_13640 [Aquimarina gracilis]|uniref:Uncharacterized protein n=1 Tax=Aquimarina gracilis TaxID=874422 RepID=A0ABU5ZXF4_9FLAO|nr:hypothetical protein [Aquimarina gracilis]MEB3346515.1 hypothetical protein [Aquimarina gracilis]